MQAVPSFWLAILLILWLGVDLELLPIGGRSGFESVIMPAITLSTLPLVTFSRITRASVVSVLPQDYVRTARAKGLRSRAVLARHVLRNGLIPLVTIGGIVMGQLLSGAVITEQIFTWPGIGWLTIQAIEARDYAVVQAVTLVTGTIIVGLNLLSTSPTSPSIHESATPRRRLGEPDAPGRSRPRRADAPGPGGVRGRAWARSRSARRRRYRPGADPDVYRARDRRPLPARACLRPGPGPAARSPGTDGHLLGTDTLGRDVFARICVAIGISLEIGAASVAIAGVFGVSVGMIAGYFGGWVDDVIMRCTDAVLAIPIVLLALSVLAVVGGGIRNLILVIAFTQWMTYARTARPRRSVREQDFVRAARAIGVTPLTMLRRHILPHLLPSATALATLNVSVAILLEAGLSYLGLGVQPPQPSLGSMLAAGRQYIFQASWLAIYPGIALLLLVLGINLPGDGVSSYLDPHRRRRVNELKPL